MKTMAFWTRPAATQGTGWIQLMRHWFKFNDSLGDAIEPLALTGAGGGPVFTQAKIGMGMQINSAGAQGYAVTSSADFFMSFPCSVSFWAHAPVGITKSIVACGYDYDPYTNLFRIGIGDIGGQVKIRAGSQSNSFTVEGAFTTGAFHLVVVEYGEDDLKLYVDNVLVDSVAYDMPADDFTFLTVGGDEDASVIVDELIWWARLGEYERNYLWNNGAGRNFSS